MPATDFMDLRTRMPIALLAILVATALIYFANHPLVQGLIVIVLAVIGSMGLWEFAKLLIPKGINIPFRLLSIGAICWLGGLYLSFFYPSFLFISGLILLLVAIALFVFHFNKIENSTLAIATSAFGFLYVVVPIGLLFKILYPLSMQDGRIWLAYLICVTKGADIGAYFLGKLFGKRRLAKSLSPSKTMMGALGGFLVSLAMSFIFYGMTYFLPMTYFDLDFVAALIFGAAIGVIGQVGDLAESLLKRDMNVKDSNILPGMGGVLDLLDSLLLTTPLLYLLMKAL